MLKLRGITKDYLAGENTVHALKGVDLAFRESEFVSILGPSGCGKTTLLNIIGGLDHYTQGDLQIDGKSTKEYSDREWDTYRNHTIGFIFQSYNLIPHQTVLSNVELALSLSGVSKSERRARAIAALEEVGLGDQLNKRPAEMSGGQMQRVAIARALVNDPSVILADEPTGALDTETSVQVLEILKAVSKDKLVIMVTHNPDLADQYSTRIIRMLDGRITGDSAPLEEEEMAQCETADCAKLQQAQGQKEKKSSMSFLTAFRLSIRNLFTKKGRTLLTSFAGSIGIIGIALILAVSQGMTQYINLVQEQSLTSYPLTVEQENISLSSMMSSFAEAGKRQDHDKDAVYENAILYNMVRALVNTEIKQNDLAKFKTYLDEQMGDPTTPLAKAVSGIGYTYDLDLQIYTKTEAGLLHSDLTSMMQQAVAMYAGNSGQNSMMMTMMQNMMNASSGFSLSLWQEALEGENGDPINKTIKEQYEVIYGTWPNSYDQVVLVVDKNNELTDITLFALGLKPESEINAIIDAISNNKPLEDHQQSKVSYDEICAKEFRVLVAGDCYQYDESEGTYVDYRTSEAGLEYLYNEKGIPMKIAGIVREKSEMGSGMMSGSIIYTHALSQYVVERAKQSPIVQAQMANPDVDVLTGMPYAEQNLDEEGKEQAFRYYVGLMDETQKADTYVAIESIMPDDEMQEQLDLLLSSFTREDMENVVMMVLPQQLHLPEETLRAYLDGMSDEEFFAQVRTLGETYIRQQYADIKRGQLSVETDEYLAAKLDEELPTYTTAQCAYYYDNVLSFSGNTYAKTMVSLGVVNWGDPISIRLYAANFEDKDVIVTEIERYNQSVETEEQISYTDYLGIMMSAVTTIINAITYVLIAFVAISLVVSSIMIAVITLISVQERTKEIGILRALGASKHNVSRMFSAETIAIGFTSGMLGVVVTYILTLPINAILHALTGIKSLSAFLPVGYAALLVVISVALTLLSGLIPSHAAAKKDPVEALRTE